MTLSGRERVRTEFVVLLWREGRGAQLCEHSRRCLESVHDLVRVLSRMAVKVSVAPLWHDCEEVQTDEASPELGGLDRDIPERFLQVPVLGPDRVDRSGRHPLLKASPRRDQVESVRLAAARGELAQSPGRLAGRGDFSEYQDCSTVRALCRRASERVGCGGGFSRRNCNPSLQIHTIQPVISFAILPPCHNDPLQYSTYGNLQIPVPANESPSPQTVGS